MAEILRRFRPFLLYAGLFSLFSNLLLLIPALYMLQVYDRVLTSRSSETLVLLTASAAIALAVMMLLDLLRTRLLAIGSLLLEKWLGPVVPQHPFAETRDPDAGVPVPRPRDVALLRALPTCTA